MPLDARRADLGDVTLAYDEYGPTDGPLALCLHGFPDTPHTFRLLAPFLARNGYHVVVPAMRGYAPSSLSTSGNYHVSALAEDANQLHEFLGADQGAVLVGHDWGAAATYVATNSEPTRWRQAITMAVPPLEVFRHSFTRYEQLHASWYMFFFQNALAELVVGLNDMAFLRELWTAWSPEYDPSDELEPLREALSSPENLRAALEYYRAMFGHRLLGTVPPDPPSVATLYLHGADDGCFLASGLGQVLESLAPNSKFTLIENAGHFVHLEQPDAVHDAIGAFLTH
ncbi:MAG TPA: alpha/beta hydrolase [Acidimicrobiales bacterium]|jgi:pimeloyl-ACP methyl ester carboxylesterase